MAFRKASTSRTISSLGWDSSGTTYRGPWGSSSITAVRLLRHCLLTLATTLPKPWMVFCTGCSRAVHRLGGKEERERVSALCKSRSTLQHSLPEGYRTVLLEFRVNQHDLIVDDGPQNLKTLDVQLILPAPLYLIKVLQLAK